MPGPADCRPRAAPAPADPHVLDAHGDERVDDWYWLRDRDDPAVRAYLEAENAYAEDVLAPLAPLRDRIFDEIRAPRAGDRRVGAGPRRPVGRTSPAPSRASSTRSTAAGRARHGSEPADEVLLDENALAAGHDYFSLGGFEVSPDHAVLAYSTDFTGGERYTLRFRDLDDRRRPRRRRRRRHLRARVGRRRAHLLLRPPRRRDAPARGVAARARHARADDVLVYREDDERFFVDIGRTR